ncbi:MAG: fibrobacter succinogenes major paralogous domain-containing protein [Chitinispirillia bacterium]|nr:fibrobacter succinogenes major paralogous domain-containing protein [Chitinispirillia bacterium]MCL2269558.1 fibrobacter succinogenes major paralogous domain-containing protein [Chitinispirillia bacterium]
MGTFTDSRNSQTYRTVKIGNGKTWMAENLNYETANSWCYNNINSNCATYGRLYTWDAAMSACPSGWSLPDTADWNALVRAAGGWEMAGTTLKSATGWNNNGNGTDAIGFSALPAGYRNTDGTFYHAGTLGYWWSATESGSGYAYFRDMSSDLANVYEINYGKGGGFSARCVR